MCMWNFGLKFTDSSNLSRWRHEVIPGGCSNYESYACNQRRGSNATVMPKFSGHSVVQKLRTSCLATWWVPHHRVDL